MKKAIFILTIIMLLTGCTNSEDFRLGYVECEEVDVSAKIPGRITRVLVTEGEQVTPGQTLAELESEEIQAKVEQARAGLQAAESQLRMARKGARVEEKEMVRRQFNIAEANLKIVQSTYQRILQVYKEGGVSTQEKETAEFRWNVAREQYEKARTYMRMVDNGARPEQIEMLEARVTAGAQKLREALSYLGETVVKAPGAGEVKQINSQAGEIVTAGFPILSVLEPKRYVIFNLREDEFNQLKIGDSLKVEIPAAGETLDLKVYYIAPLANFARYESTHEKGSWDVKTFEVRAEVPESLQALRPGMTVKIFI